MRTFTISKSNGKTRQIYAPNAEEKTVLRSLLPEIERVAEALDTNRVMHGFTRGRSPVTNALAHVGWEYTLTMDLKDFFDSVTPEMIPWVLFTGEHQMNMRLFCFVDGAARQGLPTSPALANIAAAPVDMAICAMRSKGRFTKVNFAYSRYCDDLCFSFDSPAVGEMIKQVVPEICARYGFTINESKTKLQCSRAGKRIITGVAVGDHDIAPPRWIRRRVRAFDHQLTHGIRRRHLRHLIEKIREARRRGSNASLHGMLVAGGRGLKEWMELRIPKAARSSAQLDLFANRAGVAVTRVITQVAALPGIRWLARKLVR